MISDLEKLKNGQLNGVKQLRLNNLNLIEFPNEIFDIADTLELLDLNGNLLTKLPDDFIKLKNLKILFLSNNHFTVFPQIVAQCLKLEMLGFKANKIDTIEENSFPKSLKWLILTDNKIKNLPKSIGKNIFLQKVMLAGNRLESLPLEMKKCVNIELLRISANRLSEIPDWLFLMPKLSWLAIAGNSFNSSILESSDLNNFDWSEFEIIEKIGEGASGNIFKAKLKSSNQNVAIKIFKGTLTSDGLPESEMTASIIAGSQNNLIQILGQISNHIESKKGLVMKLLPKNYSNLGYPPTFETCTRDVFDPLLKLSIYEIIKIVKQAAETSSYLHTQNINHGDIYAHNILKNDQNHIFMSDFGAASLYRENSTQYQQIEIRAWACLVEDLIINTLKPVSNHEQTILETLTELKNKCFDTNVKVRPVFKDVIVELNKME